MYPKNKANKFFPFISILLLISIIMPAVLSCRDADSFFEESTDIESSNFESETEKGTLAPSETETEPWESGGLSPDEDLIIGKDPEKPAPPKNPTKNLLAYCKSNNVGTEKITILSKYVKGLDFDVYSERDAYAKVYYLIVPCRVDLSKITFEVEHNDGSISGPYTADFADEKITNNEITIGTVSNYSIKILQTKLPSFMINIDETYGTIDELNGSGDHSVHVYGDISATVTDDVAKKTGWSIRTTSEDSDPNSPLSADIRGRGNATWGYPKRGYQVKTEEPVNLFGMGYARTYCFLSNYRDSSLVRTQLALNMGKEMGIMYTSECRQVDLFMNGKYLGTYLVCEKVEVQENRIEIDKNFDYLYEVDQYYLTSGEFGFMSNGNVKIRIHNPKDPLKIERGKLLLNSCEKTLFDQRSENYLECFDLDSWVRMFFLQQFTMNSDSYLGSFYFYYDVSEKKMYAVAPWDFDFSLGVSWHESLDDPTTYDVTNYGWMKPMFKHKTFKRAAVDMYYNGGIRDIILNAPQKYLNYAKELESAYALNDSFSHVYYFPKEANTPELGIKYVYDTINVRIEWLENFMSDLRMEVGMSPGKLKGEGSKDSPYLIEDENDFMNFHLHMIAGETFENKYFSQTQDIYAGKNVICTSGINSIFRGIYNGNGHRITVEASSNKDDCIFPTIEGALMNIIVDGSVDNKMYAAGIARAVKGDGIIINCISYVRVKGAKASGMVVSIEDNGKIYGCVFDGEIDGSFASSDVSSVIRGNGSVKGCFINSSIDVKNRSDECKPLDNPKQMSDAVNAIQSELAKVCGIDDNLLCRMKVEMRKLAFEVK